MRFTRVKDKYGFLSNFARSPILLKGKLWPSVEHYFQAQKFAGTQYEDEIRTAISPAAAAVMGRDRSKPLRLDWESVKLEIIREALWAKFTQHRKLRELLLATGEAVLIEHTRNNYWGDGGNGSGRNMLGRLLMETRARLRQEERPTQLQEV
ncbi:MAG: NADAR family protein [Anaerolineae bacterium]|nr:NADAR family protein [Anaerolineae bacterium]